MGFRNLLRCRLCFGNFGTRTFQVSFSPTKFLLLLSNPSHIPLIRIFSGNFPTLRRYCCICCHLYDWKCFGSCFVRLAILPSHLISNTSCSPLTPYFTMIRSYLNSVQCSWWAPCVNSRTCSLELVFWPLSSTSLLWLSLSSLPSMYATL